MVESLSKKDVKTLGEKGWNSQQIGTKFVEVGRVKEVVKILIKDLCSCGLNWKSKGRKCLACQTFNQWFGGL